MDSALLTRKSRTSIFAATVGDVEIGLVFETNWVLPSGSVVGRLLGFHALEDHAPRLPAVPTQVMGLVGIMEGWSCRDRRAYAFDFASVAVEFAIHRNTAPSQKRPPRQGPSGGALSRLSGNRSPAP